MSNKLKIKNELKRINKTMLRVEEYSLCPEKFDFVLERQEDDIIEEMLYQKEELLSNKAKYINPKTIKSNRRRCLKKDKQNRKNAWNCDRGSDGKSSRFSYHKRRSNEMVRRTAFVIMNGNGYRKEYDYANEIN